ncbi:MAG TPA: glycosyltransferase, partial [Chloroflexota bacterium]|nr:glycosyltransferase [Chloroflexota bacterium]
PSRTVSELYSLADVVVFPSNQEGFGVPVLEAGLARVPLVLSDIPIFREVSDGLATFFPLDASSATIAERILSATAAPQSRLFRRVVRDYRWAAIADRHLVPLVEEARSGAVSA